MKPLFVIQNELKHYIVKITLLEKLSEEFIALIPLQQEHVNLLLSNGTMTSYSLSANRSQLWTTMIAESEVELMRLLNKFPLRKFMQVEITRLAFHNSALFALPTISLN
jgi:muconolactone delta-isomerase